MLREVESLAVDVRTPDGVADSYLTRPDDRPHPAVLLMMDAYGLRPRLEEMADRIAGQGYVVLVPNLFYRSGRAPVVPLPDHSDPNGRASFFQSLRPLFEQLTPDRMADDGAAYLDYLTTVSEGPVGLVGYCMGVRQGWRVAASHPDRVAALAGFHGAGLATDAPDSPHRSAPALRAELYFGHADQDANMTPEQIETLDRALSDAGIRFRSELYAGARHGYTMSDTPVYDEAATERHFTELFALFGRTIAA